VGNEREERLVQCYVLRISLKHLHYALCYVIEIRVRVTHLSALT
jgi:hypothetical protein